MKIYTKTGDNGSTGLIGGTRVLKDDIRLEAYGSLDELNAFIGVLLSESLDVHDQDFNLQIQNNLFRVGSYLATDQSATDLKYPHPVTGEMMTALESEIDLILSTLPEAQHFILPGGNRTSAACHVCRTVCRRAERSVVNVSKTFFIHNDIIRYINRLSDYFFVLARKSCLVDSAEHFWDNTK